MVSAVFSKNRKENTKWAGGLKISIKYKRRPSEGCVRKGQRRFNLWKIYGRKRDNGFRPQAHNSRTRRLVRLRHRQSPHRLMAVGLLPPAFPVDGRHSRRRHQRQVRHQLGAGAGLPGLTAAVLGARRVVLTDVKALVPGMERNVEANGLGERVEVRELVWGLEVKEEEFDIVLMSDVFLEVGVMEDLGKTLKRVCRGGSETKVWCGSELRQWTYACLGELASLGFGVIEFPTPLGLPDDTTWDMFSIFHLIPPLVDCHVPNPLELFKGLDSA